MIYRKYYEFSIWLGVLAYKLAYSQGLEIGKSQKT